MTARMPSWRALLFFLASGAAAITQTATAQSVLRSFPVDSVRDRVRPEFDPVGVNFGSFALLPALQLSAGYDSNVRAIESPVVDDAIVNVRPTLVMRSGWARHSLTIRAAGEFQRYLDRPVENAEQYSIGGIGWLDLGSRTRLNGDFVAGRFIEPRGSSGDTALTGEPVHYRQLRTKAGIDHDFGVVQMRGSLTFDEYHYGRRRANGVLVDESRRNFRALLGDAQLTVAMGPAIGLFVRGAVNQSKYLNPIVNFNTDSTSYSVLGGLAFGITPLLYGDIGIGYFRQDYEDSSFPSDDGIDYSASINWNPTRLISASLDVGRSTQRSPSPILGGMRQTGATLTADYEIRRNIILGATLAYMRYAYGLIDRTQHQTSGALRASYLVSRMIALNLSLSHARVRPDQAGGAAGLGIGRRYDRTQILTGIRLQM